MRISSVCVYCSSSEAIAPVYKEAAAKLGQLLAFNKLRLIYGGGKLGLMGIVANAVMANHGKVVGFIPQHLDEYEGAHTGIQELYIVDSMHTRKAKMVENCDAFVILPGGFGTLDEFFEVLTWRQLELHHKPIIIVNINNYWDILIKLFQHTVKEAFAAPGDMAFISVVDSVEAVLAILLSKDVP